MPKLKNAVPKYRLHKASGKAVVTIAGSDKYLGDFGSPESRAKYDEVIADWLAAGRYLKSHLAHPEHQLTVVERCLEFSKYADGQRF